MLFGCNNDKEIIEKTNTFLLELRDKQIPHNIEDFNCYFTQTLKKKRDKKVSAEVVYQFQLELLKKDSTDIRIELIELIKQYVTISEEFKEVVYKVAIEYVSDDVFWQPNDYKSDKHIWMEKILTYLSNYKESESWLKQIKEFNSKKLGAKPQRRTIFVTHVGYEPCEKEDKSCRKLFLDGSFKKRLEDWHISITDDFTKANFVMFLRMNHSLNETIDYQEKSSPHRIFHVCTYNIDHIVELHDPYGIVFFADTLSIKCEPLPKKIGYDNFRENIVYCGYGKSFSFCDIHARLLDELDKYFKSINQPMAPKFNFYK